MKTGIKVKKADGSCEDYLHTKVLSTINNAFILVGQSDIFLAEQLSDVVTYHLYKKWGRSDG